VTWLKYVKGQWEFRNPVPELQVRWSSLPTRRPYKTCRATSGFRTAKEGHHASSCPCLPCRLQLPCPCRPRPKRHGWGALRQQLPSKLPVWRAAVGTCPLFVYPVGAIGVEDLRDCELLFAWALGIGYFLLRGGSSDCVRQDYTRRCSSPACGLQNARLQVPLGSPWQDLAAAASPCAVPWCSVLWACFAPVPDSAGATATGVAPTTWS
jgi:hypothetical protein